LGSRQGQTVHQKRNQEAFKRGVMQITCPNCQKIQQLSPANWRCECGEALEPTPRYDFEVNLINQEAVGLWRYGRLFGLDFVEPAITLGAGWTPLVSARFRGRNFHLKVEYMSPTGSFKDRGTEVEINALIRLGVQTVIDDSSGNAGSSLAAYAARAGLKARIFVPHYASENKIRQMALYGADIHSIPGMRDDAKKAAIASIEKGVVYASHAYHPCFLLGQQSVAWEVWEQLGRKAPDWYIVPVGQGVHLLGAWLGFSRLKSARLIEKIPRIVAVQPSLLDPVVRAVQQGINQIPDIKSAKSSIAEGLAIAKPVRWKRILQAIMESNGMAISVDEEKIIEAQRELASLGFYVEPTSATAFAALPHILQEAQDTDIIVTPLTGSGLKGAPRIE
jgi:threonine synthase